MTEKQQLVTARRGQGKYRQKLEQVERHCRLTGTSDPRFLIASHIKPWRDASNQEKLDGHNGFLIIQQQLAQWHLDISNVEAFSTQQCHYLAYHREYIYKGH